jgi:hypothetical protein
VKTVRVYDPDTEMLTTIPANELAPGMVRASGFGIEGDVWLEARKVAQNTTYFHPPFDEYIRDHFRRFAVTFADVYPRTVEEWENGFRCDFHADKEIACWLWMERAYLHFTRGRQLDVDQKRDIFHVVLMFVTNGHEHVLATTNPRTLSRSRIKEMIEYMKSIGN